VITICDFSELPCQYALCCSQTTRAKETSDLMRSRFKLITDSLGRLFRKGSSGDLVTRALEIKETDPIEARRLFTLAANQGHAKAQLFLALMNSKCEGW
jgi:TPR repeat protein